MYAALRVASHVDYRLVRVFFRACRVLFMNVNEISLSSECGQLFLFALASGHIWQINYLALINKMQPAYACHG